jgi:hypothetical protein
VPFELSDGLELRFAHKPEERAVTGHRQNLDRQTGLASRAAKPTAPRASTSRRQCRCRNIRRDLNQLRFGVLFTKKPTILGNIKINERDAATRHRDLYFLGLAHAAHPTGKNDPECDQVDTR